MQKILGFFLYILPKNILSYWVGRLVHVRLPDPLRLLAMKWFANRYRLNLDEAEKPLDQYPSIGELFIRKLKPEARLIAGDCFAVHPCDAALTTNGKIEEGTLLQAKGKYYGLREFLVADDLVEKARQGSFFTYYLCPTDYHRVHSPVEGEVNKVVYIPGTLWPVNAWSVSSIDGLFSLNERLVVEIETARGPVILVMVGATNVGKMSLSFDRRWQTNQFEGDQPQIHKYAQKPKLRKGQELGIFHMGSTVILVLPRQIAVGEADFASRKVKMGEKFLR